MTDDEWDDLLKTGLRERDRARLSTPFSRESKQAADARFRLAVTNAITAHTHARAAEAVATERAAWTAELAAAQRVFSERADTLSDQAAELEASLKDLGRDYAELGRIRDRLRVELAAEREKTARLTAKLADRAAPTPATPATAAPEGARSGADGTEPSAGVTGKATPVRRRKTAPRAAKEGP
jgi:hypothetical protein